ncbi:MAG: nucleoside monophosphate kinase [Opitutales bacterium]|nr:nucleoside monophosphate kinase [Opitutales bacterium]
MHYKKLILLGAIMFQGLCGFGESTNQNTLETYLKRLEQDDSFFTRIPKKIIWLSGAPGAGKGTNTQTIIENAHLYKEPVVVSSLLKTPEMREKINKGILIDDEVVVKVLFAELQKPIYQQGIVIDGFPRKEGQAKCIEWLYQNLKARNLNPQFSVITLMVSEEESVKRQLHRGQLAQQQANGKEEVRATDLDPELVRNRYKTFMKETYSALQLLEKKIPFVTIDASGSFDEVKQQVLDALHTLKLM